ncbi:MAG: PIN domain-containing protein [Desulfurococcales archaeon]|nr:PIN domain-containing protein [Desulfurococcales archaeon]
MIKIVIDTNILISAILTPGRVRNTLLNPQTHPHAPKRIITETIKHADKISRYTGIEAGILKPLLQQTLPRWIATHNEEQIPPGVRERAKRLVKDVDPDDWPFVALSMHLGIPLWTGDKELIKLAVRTEFQHFKALDTRGVEMLLEGKPWSEVEEYLRREYGREEVG